MKLALVTYGSRGDVQPFLVLADALVARGHEVTLIVSKDFAPWCARAGVAHVALPVDIRETLHRAELKRIFDAGTGSAFLRWAAEHGREHLRAFAELIDPALARVDAVVTNLLLAEHCAASAAKYRIPMVPLHLFPMIPSAAYPNPFVTVRTLPGWLNRATHGAIAYGAWLFGKDFTREYRRLVSAPPPRSAIMTQLSARRMPELSAHSPTLLPRPHDWHEEQRVTGALTMPPSLRERLGEAAPAEELVRWLDAGEPPIYLGFGSIPVMDEAKLRVLVRGLKRRFVVGAGWGKLPVGYADEQLYVVGPVDHAWLMPRCAASVHHGGAGTTHAAAAAGRPSVVAHVFADQPVWGKRIESLGIGTHLPFRGLDASRMHDALARALAPEVVKRASDVGRTIREEDGVSTTCDTLFEVLPRTPIPH